MPETDLEIIKRLRAAQSFASESRDETDDEVLARIRQAGGQAPTLTSLPNQPAPLSLFPATLGGPAGALTPAAPGPGPQVPRATVPLPPPSRKHAPGIQFAGGAVLSLVDLFAIGANIVQGVGEFGMPGAGGFELHLDEQGRPLRPESGPYLGTRIARAVREWAEKNGLGKPVEGTWETAERMLGEEFGAGLPFYLGVVGYGKKLERAGETARFFPKLFQHAGRYPKLFTAEEAVGVAGTALGRTTVPEDSPLSQFIMGAVGGLGASAGFQTLATIGRGVRFLADLSRSAVPQERSIARAAQMLQQSAGKRGTELALEALNRYRFGADVPGVTPTLGAVTGNYGIQTLERDLAVRYPDFNLRLQMAQQGGNESLVRQMIEKGRYYGDPVDEARAAASAHLEGEIDRIRKRIRETIPAEDRDPETLSEAFRAELQQIHDAIYEPLNNRYNELTAIMDSLGEEFSTEPLKKAVRRLREFEGYAPPLEGLEEPGSAAREAIQLYSGEAPEGLISQIENLPDKAPANILHSLRRQLRDAVRDSPPERRRYRTLVGILLDGAEETMEDVKDIGLSRRRSPELREAAEELDVLDAEFREYARIFRETREQGITTTGRVLSKHGPAATEMLAEYARPGRGLVERLRNFKEAFRGNTAAIEAMEDYLVFEAYQTARDKLGIPTRSLAVFKRRYRKQLEEFPKAAERMRSLERLGEEAKSLGIYGPTTDAAIRMGAVKLFVDDPVKAIRYIARLPSEDAQRLAMWQLVQKTSGNPEARNGLRQLLWQELITRGQAVVGNSDTQSLMLSGANIHKYLSEHRGVFEALYSPAELQNLDELARTAGMLDQIPVVRTQRGQEPPERLLELIQKSGWWRPVYSTRLKLIRTMRAMSLLQKDLTDAQASNVLLEALVNPRSQLATALLSEINPNSRRFLVNWISKNLPTFAPRMEMRSETNRTALPGG